MYENIFKRELQDITRLVAHNLDSIYVAKNQIAITTGW